MTTTKNDCKRLTSIHSDDINQTIAARDQYLRVFTATDYAVNYERKHYAYLFFIHKQDNSLKHLACLLLNYR